MVNYPGNLFTTRPHPCPHARACHSITWGSIEAPVHPDNCSTGLRICLTGQALAPDRKAKSRNYSDPVPKRPYAPLARRSAHPVVARIRHRGASRRRRWASRCFSARTLRVSSLRRAPAHGCVGRGALPRHFGEQNRAFARDRAGRAECPDPALQLGDVSENPVELVQAVVAHDELSLAALRVLNQHLCPEL